MATLICSLSCTAASENESDPRAPSALLSHLATLLPYPSSRLRPNRLQALARAASRADEAASRCSRLMRAAWVALWEVGKAGGLGAAHR